ncbi:MAG: hypothetical protein Q9228_002155 [Teloschistes exilis]
MDVDEDGDYSDDDLDALPDDLYHQLQEDAIASTQHTAKTAYPTLPPALPSAGRPQVKATGALAGGLERLSVTSNYPAFSTEAWQEFPNQPSSDYGDLDDDMLDGEIYDAAEEPGVDAIQASRAANLHYGESTQREQWRHQRYSIPGTHLNSAIPPEKAMVPQRMLDGANGHHVEAREAEELTSPKDGGRSSNQSNIDALHAEILELRRERVDLEKAKKAAEDIALAKSGEVAIIRANQSKSEKIFESKLNALQKLHADEAARQKVEVERAQAEKRKIATEKGFLQNDITEGNARIRELQRAVKAKAGVPKATSNDDERTGLPTTPRKNKGLNHGDGFDDEEVQFASSSQLPYRSKAATPKAGSKRKRKPIDASPVKPLQLSQADEVSFPVEVSNQSSDVRSAAATIAPPIVPVAPMRTAAFPDEQFILTQRVMNYRKEINGKRTFEVFAEYFYPSKPDTALSTVFLDKMSTIELSPGEDNFPVALAQVVVSMWKQCVDEQLWKPVHLLLDLVSFILCDTPVSTGPLLVDTILEVIQSTADVNIIPRVRRQPAHFSADVNTFDCLELLKSIASDCLHHEEDIVRFWRCMRFDFIAMILNVVQPIDELHLTLRLLRTSIQDETFAMIVPPNDGKQTPSEMNLIDLLTRLLVETPKQPKEEESYDVIDIAQLRLSVLSLMGEMVLNQHSSKALATSQHAIGRLVWLMNDELDALYDHKFGYEVRAQLVNEATRLLFRLRTDHPQLINMQEKLKIIPCSGGVHKHLIVLTRLALSEGVFFEEEIEDDVVECAYEMLEDLSSPEEAEALRGAFSTARSR